MSELRQCPISGHWVVLSSKRAERPQEFAVSRPARRVKTCSFCEWHETETPSEIVAFREPGSAPNVAGWRVRVVPNKYPALLADADLTTLDHRGGRGMVGAGLHEVIIETPRHVVSTTDLTDAELREVLWIYRDRLVHLKEDDRIAWCSIFKNVGPDAGATIEHTHSQLIALPIVPSQIRDELERARSYYDHHGSSLFRAVLDREKKLRERVVLETKNFIVFCPYAARTPYETWLFPKTAQAHFADIDHAHASELARLLREVLRGIEVLLDRPAYNYYIHTAPFDIENPEHYHWHVEIIPRVTKIAGFEFSSGCYINTLPPEQAAEALREATAANQGKP